MKAKTTFLYVSLLVGVSIGLVSCGDDDSEGPQASIDAKALVGSWDAVSQQLKDCPDPADNAINSCGTEAYCISITFNENGTYTESGATDIKNYNAEEGIISLCLSYKGCDTWIYTVTGNQLQLQQVNSTECSEVLTFTKTN